jgi:hypothetical protein
MPRDTRVPRLDPADNDELQALADGVARVVQRRAPQGATYEEERRVTMTVIADLMWLSEENKLQALTTTAERVIVDGKGYRRLNQPSSSSYHGLWGTHVITEPLYRREGVRNGATLKPLSLVVEAIGDNLLPDAARVLGLLRASNTSVEIERTLAEMGYRPPSRAYIEKHVTLLAGEMNAQIAKLEIAVAKTETNAAPVAGVSCGLDRMAVRMDEPLPEGTVREDRPPRKKPYERTPPPPAEHNWRMAWVASMTEYDADGAPLRTRRYGTDAGASRDELADRVIADVKSTLSRNPGIPVVSIQDGAKDLSALPAGLDAAMSDDDLNALPDKLGAELTTAAVFHLTDFHHAISYLDEVARLCEPEGDPHNMRLWYRSVLLHDANGVDVILRHLKYRQKTLPEGKPLAAVNKAFKYIHKRRKTMRYADVAKHGLPVGSGATESTCGLFQLTVKRPGAAWGAPGLRGVMTLRGLVLSDRWSSAWSQYTATRRRRVTRARKPHRARPQHRVVQRATR